MSNARRWITLLLASIALILLGLALQERNAPPHVVINPHEPTYTSSNSSTVVYDPMGNLSYKLISDKTAWYSADEVSWFDNPLMTTWNASKEPAWSIRSDKAKLTKDRKLYLYGHVELNTLTQDAQLKRIKTDNALINLVTQDITSEDKVTLYGRNFTSIGLMMHGNLRTKTAELLEKVKTNYEIQNESPSGP